MMSKNSAVKSSMNPILRNLILTSSSDMRMRHIMKSNINTMNASGAIAGATKVEMTFQLFRLTDVPGSGERNAISNAKAIRMRRSAPKSLIKPISYNL